MKPYYKIHKIFAVLFTFLLVNTGFSQKVKIAKANKELDKFSYINAREIYLEVVKDGYKSPEIFKNLGDTYYYNSDYNNAAKWYQKLITNYPSQIEPIYYYRTSQSLKALEKFEDSDKLMELFANAKDNNNNIVIQFHKENPNYLQTVSSVSKKYIIEKVAINTKYSDFGPSYFGDKLVYASSSNESGNQKKSKWNQQPFLDLFSVNIDDKGKLSNVERLQGEINTDYHESSTSFSKDGKTVYFTRNNFINGKKERDKNKTIRLKLYKATHSGDGIWSDIQELPFNSKEYSVAHPALSLNQKRLYFSSDMPGTIGMSDLWYVDILGENTYGEPVNLGPEINTGARESFPFISDKGNLYYSTDGRSGLGGYDVYTTKLTEEGMPTEIINLGKPANSSQDDFGFIINEEKRIGYLSSNRDGQGGSIDDEIYLVNEKCEITSEGTVFDQDTKEKLSSTKIQVFDENNRLVKEVATNSKGKFQVTLDCDKPYIIKSLDDEGKYIAFEKLLKIPDQDSSVILEIAMQKLIQCPPEDLGCRLNLQPIYFDLDMHNIRLDAEVELAKILAAMRTYPKLNIHIESHTDSRSSLWYNARLSERRAKSTLEWLVKKGIDRNRLTSKGYGEYQLINKCKDNIDCSEEEHQENRRSMFIIK